MARQTAVQNLSFDFALRNIKKGVETAKLLSFVYIYIYIPLMLHCVCIRDLNVHQVSTRHNAYQILPILRGLKTPQCVQVRMFAIVENHGWDLW